MKNELDGVNRLVFAGPFSAYLSDEKKTEIQGDRLVIVSKNGSVAEIPVSQLKTIRQVALEKFLEMVQPQKTVPGAEKVLRAGAVMLGGDLYWHKPETTIRRVNMIQEEKSPMSIQELKELSKEI